ncbi:MAG: chlorophyll synthesis pathway protein BchC [Pseudomonadota bacterium]|jgi:3-hydroxyethyl bacteriochlorophyllide a dehydrogenase
MGVIQTRHLNSQLKMTTHRASAVILDQPGSIALREVDLTGMGAEDVRVRTAFSGISTGTERLFYTGEMPAFPGMGYPLVPGYETVGEVIEAGSAAQLQVGEWVFVPGANCYGPIRGLFGGASSELITAGSRALRIAPDLQQQGVLMALAATAHHALAGPQYTFDVREPRAGLTAPLPDLIVGHGVMGRLLARMIVALGGSPLVWETDTKRHAGAQGYRVHEPSYCKGQSYSLIVDASGAGQALSSWIDHLRPGGELVLAGFYTQQLSFGFVPAFLREARIRVAAQWQPSNLLAAAHMVSIGALSLDGLITDEHSPEQAPQAYAHAFSSSEALKVVLDWRKLQ